MFGLKNTSNCISAVFVCVYIRLLASVHPRNIGEEERSMWMKRPARSGAQRPHCYWCINAKWQTPFTNISNGHFGISIRLKCAPIHWTLALFLSLHLELYLCVYVYHTFHWHVENEHIRKTEYSRKWKNANIWIWTYVRHTNYAYKFALLLVWM